MTNELIKGFLEQAIEGIDGISEALRILLQYYHVAANVNLNIRTLTHILSLGTNIWTISYMKNHILTPILTRILTKEAQRTCQEKTELSFPAESHT